MILVDWNSQHRPKVLRAGLNLSATLPQPLKYRDYIHHPPCSPALSLASPSCFLWEEELTLCA